jgi:hypothetical protein
LRFMQKEPYPTNFIENIMEIKHQPIAVVTGLSMHGSMCKGIRHFAMHAKSRNIHKYNE